MNHKHLALAFGVVVSTAVASAAQPYSIQWQTQFGTGLTDSGNGVATDPTGNVFIAGETFGTLSGSTKIGQVDAFLRKYSSTGALLWSRQLGTTGVDQANAVAVDVFGNAYISGYSTGDLPVGGSGNVDAYLAKIDPAGNTLWSRQIGLRGNDLSNGVTVDPFGNVVISGYSEADDFQSSPITRDSFAAKFDSGGNLLWNKKVGFTEFDESKAVGADSLGNVYLAGRINNSGYLKKLDPQGETLWTKQFAAAPIDQSHGLAVDKFNNIYVGGLVYDATSGGTNDPTTAYLRKFDSAGNEVWARTLGNIGPMAGLSVAVDASGNPFLAGNITDDPTQQSSSADVFVAKFNAAGNQLWMDRQGSTVSDIGNSVAVDNAGGVYFAGYTEGSLAGTNFLSGDAFLIKYAPVPEPSSLAMMVACGGFSLAVARRRPARRVAS